MEIIFKKNFKSYFTDEPGIGLITSFLGLLLILTSTAEDFTPRYAKMWPFTCLFILLVSSYYVLRTIFWFNKGDSLNLDLKTMLIKEPNKNEVNVSGCRINLLLRKKHDEKAYQIEFITKSHILKYKTPVGYECDLTYDKLFDIIKEHELECSMSYSPLFKIENNDSWLKK